jgi:hypothetical protein
MLLDIIALPKYLKGTSRPTKHWPLLSKVTISDKNRNTEGRMKESRKGLMLCDSSQSKDHIIYLYRFRFGK